MKASLSLIMLLLMSSAWGGGTAIVGNGGGFAELQTLEADHRLVSILEKCPVSTCATLFADPTDRQSFISYLLKAPGMHFKSECSSVWSLKDGQLLLSSCLLYQETSAGLESLSFGKLLSLVFAARMTSKIGDPSNFAAWAERARKVFDSIQFQIRTINVVSQQPARLHAWTIGYWGAQQSFLSVESETRSQDITDLVVLPCRGPVEQWQVRFDEASERADNWLVGTSRVEWSCRQGIPNRFQALLKIALARDGQDIALERSKVSLSLVEELP